ncbi:MAG: sigma 54-interacting transcriptional regulator [Bacteroides sp.]|nr:sigma 54-interacting transcriptional regulator [Prevotella sp.]MCM1407302.1 sigma 54-interacting transcriptional regulator [Treponema brennaborense]MCM1469790.1 sigma 54-interacting transcriptional regulator [Bacteroides sp.]
MRAGRIPSDSADVEKLNALIEINALINSSYGDVDALLVYILESASRLAECESAVILLTDRSSSQLRFKAVLGFNNADVRFLSVARSSIAGWCVDNDQSLIVDDAQNEPRFYTVIQEQTGYAVRNLLAVPLHSRGACIGVIELLNKKGGRAFCRPDLEILELLADQAGIAYQNADMYLLACSEIRTLQNTILQGSGYHTFISQSSVVKDLLEVVEKAAQTNSSVLILGESGVGKELFAEQLHVKSARKDKPFVRVNCAALSPALLESELFGHVKGAFTGADRGRKGRFEMADGGTIFLDEIGELPVDLQAKLLRVIQDKTLERVGANETFSVDVRIVAATNRDLEAMVSAGIFRSDLYYRLNVLPLYIPPLRQRKEDIEPLAAYFCRKFSAETKKDFFGFSQDALEAMYAYHWPGNVRELKNCVERACVLGKPPYIYSEDLCIKTSAAAECRKNCSLGIDAVFASGAAAGDETLKTAVRHFKKAYISKILEKHNWNQTETSKILGIQRTYISRLMNELGIR